MNKKGVPVADLLKLFFTVKHFCLSKDFSALNASKHLYGKRHTIESIAGVTGLNYGSLKITVCDRYPSNQDTANLNLSKSRITGLRNRLQRFIITDTSSILSMMRHISTRMVAL